MTHKEQAISYANKYVANEHTIDFVNMLRQYAMACAEGFDLEFEMQLQRILYVKP